MKQIFTGLLLGVWILTACRQVPAGDVPATVASTLVPSPTETPAITPPTFTPSQTSIPPTQTITPLPTIPTFTPTFEARTIVTVTPAAKAECPGENNSLNLDFRFDDYSINSDEEIPRFLNRGGTIEKVIGELSRVYSENSYRYVDITNDGVSDLIFDGFQQLYDTFYILWCQDGHYNVFSGQEAKFISMANRFYQIVDMNKNGLPEIVIYRNNCTGNGCYQFFIGEWNGKTFVNLAPEIYLEGVKEEEIEIKDINNDGTLELILVGSSYDFKVPWRQSIHTYIWDGSTFIEQPIEYVQPVYRFQAIQDADAAVLVGKYDRAMQLYQEAISNQNLEWWSIERRDYEQIIIDAPWFHTPTPSVKPMEDKTEYYRLTAYAYYRIMLLHIVQGHESDAGTVYKTLQQKFGNDSYGRPYVEMATAFWNTYQSTHRMYDSCAVAIQYAVAHAEILTPLGDGWAYGSQSHTYVPADVCPFR
jgi:hypothetical protein